jgi:plasmid stability protein
MVSYILRNIDEDFWKRIKSKAALEGLSVKSVIINLLTDWVKKK